MNTSHPRRLFLPVLVAGLTLWLGYVLNSGGHPALAASAVTAGVVLCTVYLMRRHIATKYLVPGALAVAFLQLWPLVFTAGVSFTNLGAGYSGSQEAATASIIAQSSARTADSATYPMTVAVREGQSRDSGQLVLLLTMPANRLDPGGDGTASPVSPADRTRVGPPHQVVKAGDEGGLRVVPPADVERDRAGRLVAVSGYQLLTEEDQARRAQHLSDLAIPTGERSAIRASGDLAYEGTATASYDPVTDRLTDSATGRTYQPRDGQYVATDGSGASYPQGWLEGVGFSNYLRVFTDEPLRGRFVAMLVWNTVVPLGTVTISFVIGLALALLFDGQRLRGDRIYRALLLVPALLPVFVTALMWRLLLRPDDGLGSRLPGGTDWLGTPWPARVAVLAVTIWTGVPLMLVACRAALRSIPAEIRDAATLDGASRWQRVTSIVLPITMLEMGPLLLAAVAMWGNGFTIIYLLTRGGPFLGPLTHPGATDLHITYAYRLAFAAESPDYGFAAAVSCAGLVFTAFFVIPAMRILRDTRTAAERRHDVIRVTGAGRAAPHAAAAIAANGVAPSSPVRSRGGALTPGSARVGAVLAGTGPSPWWRHVVALVAVTLAVAPVLLLLVAALSGIGGLTGLWDLLADGQRPFWDWYRTSLITAGLGAALSLMVGAGTAYAVSHLRFRGRQVVRDSLDVARALPLALGAVGLLLIFDWVASLVPPFGSNALGSLVLAYLGLSIAASTWLLRTVFEEVPRTVEDVTRLDGVGHLRLFAMVVRHQRAAVLGVLARIFIALYAEFLIASVLLRDVAAWTLGPGLLDLADYAQTTGRPGAFAMAAVLVCIPVVLVYPACRWRRSVAPWPTV